MKIGVVKEIKTHEYRVALTPAGADELIRAGNQVLVEAGAGEGSGLDDERYRAAGATVLGTVDEVWAEAEAANGADAPPPRKASKASGRERKKRAKEAERGEKKRRRERGAAGAAADAGRPTI